MSVVPGWMNLEERISRLARNAADLQVLLIANLKRPAPYASDYAGHSVTTEYLSGDELEAILGGLRESGLYVQTLSSEEEFLRTYLVAPEKLFIKNRMLMYALAQAGTGPGRKALLPAFAEMSRLPYVGSDPHVVCLARHKFHLRCVLKSLGFPTPDTWLYTEQGGWLGGVEPTRRRRVILKLSYESASIGLDSKSVLETGPHLAARAEALAVRYRQPITVQEFISGYEVEIPVIGLAEPFAPMAVGISIDGSHRLDDRFLDYDRVYADDYGFYPFSSIDVTWAGALRACAVNVFKALGIRDFGRIDARVDLQGRFYITDIATTPHITPHSSFAFAFQTHGRPYAVVPMALIGTAAGRLGWFQDSDQN